MSTLVSLTTSHPTNLLSCAELSTFYFGLSGTLASARIKKTSPNSVSEAQPKKLSRKRGNNDGKSDQTSNIWISSIADIVPCNQLQYPKPNVYLERDATTLVSLNVERSIWSSHVANLTTQLRVPQPPYLRRKGKLTKKIVRAHPSTAEKQ